MRNALLGATVALTPLLVLVVAFFTLYQRTQMGRIGWCLLAAAYVAGLHLFSSWFVPWHWLGDAYKVAFTVGAGGVVAICYLRQMQSVWLVANSTPVLAGLALVLFGIVLADKRLGVMSDIQLDLQSPIIGAKFHVAQGGGNAFINHHYRDATQRYAADLVVIDGHGQRGKKLYSNNLTDYFSFGYPLVAPCSGTVSAKSNRAIDQPIGQSDIQHPAGNYIAISCGKFTALLAHLQLETSSHLKVGDYVKAGQLIGHIGNSGNTSEPHLHLHVVVGAVESDSAFPFSGVGIPFTIQERKTTRGRFD